MKYLLSLTILLLLTAASCRKNKTTEQLPPETHEGKFTFGCKVDGKIYTVSGQEGLLAMEYVQYYIYPPDSSIHISVRSRYTNKSFDFDFEIHYTGTTGTYLLKGYPYPNTMKFADHFEVYSTTLDHTGRINIKYFNGKFSPSNPNPGTILSGTFEMDAVNAEGKVIHITEGRFDIGQ